MNRRQLLLVIGSVAMVVALMGAAIASVGAEEDDGRTKVVATFYPLAYMAERIGGERVSVTSLVPYNSELHSWQPAPQDMIRADRADLILYNGGPADAWLMSEVVPGIGAADKLIVNTTVGVQYISGGDEHEGEGGVDPHTWLSPKRALVQALNVYRALCEVDPNGSGYFAERFGALNRSLTLLDAEYEGLSNGSVSGIIISHAAFGYVAYDYGFEQHGAIGLSADQEPSITNMIKLVELMKEEGIYTVLVDPVYNDRYGQVLQAELERKTGSEVTVLSIHLALGPYEDEAGRADYVDQLASNLVSLKAGLGVG